MNIADKVRRILRIEDEALKKSTMTIDDASRAWIEVYKDRLENEIIGELHDLDRTYDIDSKTQRLDLFRIVLFGEREEYRNAINNLVAEYAIARRIATLYDDMIPKTKSIKDDDKRYKCAIIKYSDIASMHPNYRAMGGKLKRDRFYDLIKQVHQELS